MYDIIKITTFAINFQKKFFCYILLFINGLQILFNMLHNFTLINLSLIK